MYTNKRVAAVAHSHRLHFEKFLWTISLLWEVQQKDHTSIFFSRRPSISRSHGIPIHHTNHSEQTQRHTQYKLQFSQKCWIVFFLYSNDGCKQQKVYLLNGKSSLNEKNTFNQNKNQNLVSCYPGWVSDLCMWIWYTAKIGWFLAKKFNREKNRQ